MLDLFLRFFYVGLFTVGGGLASIPLLLQVVVDAGLVDRDLFYNMIAISESTPGPIGINIATYIGYTKFGIPGSILCSIAVMIPCFTITYFVSKAIEKFSSSSAVQTAFYGIRACVCGMISVAAFGIIELSMLDVNSNTIGGYLNLKAVGIFIVIYFLFKRYKKHPAVYIALGAVLGMLIL